jgi:hypothetical protein
VVKSIYKIQILLFPLVILLPMLANAQREMCTDSDGISFNEHNHNATLIRSTPNACIYQTDDGQVASCIRTDLGLFKCSPRTQIKIPKRVTKCEIDPYDSRKMICEQQ